MLSAWAEITVNRILVIAATALALMALKDYLRLLSLLGGALIRSRGNIEIEHSVSRARSRNRCAIAGLFMVPLLISRYNLYPATILNSIPKEYSAATFAGILIAYLLLRGLLYHIFLPRKLDHESRKATHSALYNYFLCALPLLLATVGVMHIFNVPDAAIRWALWVEGLCFICLSLMRKGQILRGKYSSLKSFLYLCALEMLPLACLVIPAAML